jgi:hypothetical protein
MKGGGREMCFSLLTSREIMHELAFVAGEEYASMIKWSTKHTTATMVNQKTC